VREVKTDGAQSAPKRPLSRIQCTASISPSLNRAAGASPDGTGAPTYQTIATYRDGIDVVIPPRSTAVPTSELGSLVMITKRGRLTWQVATNYGQRSLVETTMGRYKALIGPQLRARGFAAQQTEAAIGVAVLNPMLAAGRPKSVRGQAAIA
jgi:hypothetical protein